jgi:phycoerythrin-associated linker protein
MDIAQFVAQSIGQWKSQRSAHHLIFQHFEAVQSIIDILPLDANDPAVLALCEAYQVDPSLAVSPFKMFWEGESDWDENEVTKGNTVLVPIPDPSKPNAGKLLREQGYAESGAAAGHYEITESGMFVLTTQYERAAAEERIWFENPNLRFRFSMIKTSAGSGVVTASFASEIRVLNPAE